MNQFFNDKLIFNFVNSWASFGYDFAIGMKHQDGTVSIMEPIAFKKLEDGFLLPKSSIINMPKESAQDLMDAMWSAGVRPSNGEGNVGQIGAMREHLDDMRRIVFKGDVKQRVVQ